jgi:purine-binding chemotaxis protein CheW
MEDQLVVFRLANDLYGVTIGEVQGINKMQDVTTMPMAEDFVEGVINLRGSVLPIIDLRRRFRLPREEHTKDTRIVVVNAGGTTVGMIVDEVTGVQRAARDDIEPPSPVVTTVDSAFIRGIAKVGESLVILLDLSKVLTVQEKAQLEELVTA